MNTGTLAGREISEAERLRGCEVALRQELTKLEQVHPDLSRLTSGIRVQLCDLLAALNALRVTLGAQAMAEPVTEARAQSLMKAARLQSLHRAGDHTLDPEEGEMEILKAES